MKPLFSFQMKNRENILVNSIQNCEFPFEIGFCGAFIEFSTAYRRVRLW